MTLPAGAALGSTKDPKALIKGEPSQVHTTATSLTTEASRIEGLAAAFADVRIDGWEGGMGQSAYAAKQAAEQAKWTTYADVLAKAGRAMSTYAGALSAAQSSAADAIAKWEEGKEASLEAKRAYNHAVRSYNASLRTRATVSTPGAPAGPAAQAERPGPFVDPGAAMREEARQILHDARQTLDAAGGSAIVGLGGAPATGGGAAAGRAGSAQASASANRDATIKWNGFARTFGRDATKGAQGDYDGSKVGAAPASKFSKEEPRKPSKFSFNVGSAQAQASIWSAETSFKGRSGPVDYSGGASATAGGVSANAAASLSRDGLSITAGAKADLLRAQANMKAGVGPLEVATSAEASAGAEVNSGVKVTPTSVHANYAAFVGFKAAVKESVEAGPVKADGAAEGQGGFGLSGDAHVGLHDGQLSLGGSSGVAFLVGGKISGGVTIDLGKAKDTLGDAAGAIGGIFG